jgi:hypothetical protein
MYNSYKVIPILIFLTIFVLSFPSTVPSKKQREISNMDGYNLVIEEHHLDEAFKDMMVSIKEGNLSAMLRSKFSDFKNDFDGERIGYSLHQYIKAELDFVTTGTRGIGRVTEDVPRFGGYYRKQLSEMNPEKLKNLYDLIQMVMLSSYLTGTLMMSEELEQAVVTDKNELFERWIPNIYVTPFNSLGSGLQNALLSLCDRSLENLLKFLENNKIEKKGIFSKDKANEIILYYMVAGCGLRITETGN